LQNSDNPVSKAFEQLALNIIQRAKDAPVSRLR